MNYTLCFLITIGCLIYFFTNVLSNFKKVTVKFYKDKHERDNYKNLKISRGAK